MLSSGLTLNIDLAVLASIFCILVTSCFLIDQLSIRYSIKQRKQTEYSKPFTSKCKPVLINKVINANLKPLLKNLHILICSGLLQNSK